MTVQHFEGRDLTLVADVMGDPRNDAVLLLHGGGQTRASWGNTLEAVAHAGFYGLAFDLRGHGDSGWDRDGDYGLAAFADDLRAVIAQLDRRPFIVGASLGGLTGLLVAGEYPDLVKGLVLVDIVPRIVRQGADRILNFMTARPDGYASIEEAADDVARFLPNRRRPADPRGILRNLRLRDDGRFCWHWDAATLDAEHVRDPSIMLPRLESAARGLRPPTLLVRGGRSDVIDQDGVRAFLSQAPHTKVVNVADAEHMVAGDRNDVFSQAVLEFLKAHRANDVWSRLG